MSVSGPAIDTRVGRPTRLAGAIASIGELGATLVIATFAVVGLLAVSGGYGYHRDELYFIVAGRHPALGYPDQPPFTPLASAAAVELLGLSPVSIRILPALAMGLLVILTALIARDLGGSRRALTLAALTMAVSGFLAIGHLDVTATYDAVAWAAVLWLLVRLLAGADSRLWVAVGVVAGLALQNKHLILLLAAGLVAGLVLTRRWGVLRSPWPYAAAGIAALIWAPNLAWQAANGFPQLEMARSISAGAGKDQAMLVPELLLLAGALLFPVTIAGLWWLLRSAAATAWRPLAWAFLVVLGLVIVVGGRSYYATGFFPVCMAAGAIVLDGWLGRGRRLRSAMFGVVAAVSGIITATIVLPLVPVSTLASTPIPAIYSESGEQVGWPTLAGTVTSVAAGLTPAERDRAIVLTSNYGEAGAVELLGATSLPVYSGHNGYWDWGPPPDARDIVVRVGSWPVTFDAILGSCSVMALVDNGYGVDNEELGTPVAICRDLPRPWSETWELFRHLG